MKKKAFDVGDLDLKKVNVDLESTDDSFILEAKAFLREIEESLEEISSIEIVSKEKLFRDLGALAASKYSQK